MKKVIIAAALLMSLNSVGVSQTINSSKHESESKHERKNLSLDERSKKEAEKAQRDLSLNAQQKVKWQEASLTRIKSNTPLKEKIKGSTTPEEREQIRRQMRTNNQNFDSSIASILTPDQKTKLEELKKVHKAHKAHNEKIRHNSTQ